MNHRIVFLAILVALGGCQSKAARVDTPEAAVQSKAEAAAPAMSSHSGFEDSTASELAAAISGAHRSADNRARDVYRHPQETLNFFGITPSMHVLEITPGAGWYSEILAPWLKEKGQFIAAIWDEGQAGAPKYYAALNQQLRDKFAANPALYGSAKLIAFDTKAPNFSAAGPLDAIVTFRNVHNWTMGGNDGDWFKAFFAALKPGGVLGVVDHRAVPDTSLEATLKTGYLTEDYVIERATAAGFVLEARSEINANPKDSKDHPSGVWTLPPTLGMKDQDRDKYLAIGESDRMTLRFRKPATH